MVKWRFDPKEWRSISSITEGTDDWLADFSAETTRNINQPLQNKLLCKLSFHMWTPLLLNRNNYNDSLHVSLHNFCTTFLSCEQGGIFSQGLSVYCSDGAMSTSHTIMVVYTSNCKHHMHSCRTSDWDYFSARKKLWQLWVGPAPPIPTPLYGLCHY